MSDWLDANGVLLTWLAAGSGVAFVATLVIIPLLVIRLPPDYFAGPPPVRPGDARRHPVLRGLRHVLKNLLGALLVLAGIAMLVLPGQGLLTIFLGLVLTDFPRKRALEYWLITRPVVFTVVNHLRERAGRAPLILGHPRGEGG